MLSNPFAKERLFCPGPTPVPLTTTMAAMRTSVYHRTEEFYSQLSRCRELLAPFTGSKNLPLILTCSGTGAMEAAVTNLTARGDDVVVVDGGKFGERWKNIAEAFGCKVRVFSFPWGEAPDVKKLATFAAENKNCRAVFFQANETSTGVHYPVAEITAALRQALPQTLIVVDAISSLVAHEMKMDEWGIDCLVSASQKGFGVPPGLAFVTLSARANDQLAPRDAFYLNLKKERDNQAKGQSAYTPAISLVLSLLASLELLSQAGPAGCAAHHRRLALACRKAVEAIGLTLFPKSHPSQALTAAEVPTACFNAGLMAKLRERGYVFAGGQDQLKNKIIRIAHLGFVDEYELLGAIGAFETALALTGHRHDLGVGAHTFLKTLATL